MTREAALGPAGKGCPARLRSGHRRYTSPPPPQPPRGCPLTAAARGFPEAHKWRAGSPEERRGAEIPAPPSSAALPRRQPPGRLPQAAVSRRPAPGVRSGLRAAPGRRRAAALGRPSGGEACPGAAARLAGVGGHGAAPTDRPAPCRAGPVWLGLPPRPASRHVSVTVTRRNRSGPSPPETTGWRTARVPASVTGRRLGGRGV